MKLRPYKIFGVLLVLAGIAALIHPQVRMPSKKNELQIGSAKYIMETTRIVTIPWYISTLIVLSGVAFFFSYPAKR
jgi:hypothetical protein